MRIYKLHVSKGEGEVNGNVEPFTHRYTETKFILRIFFPLYFENNECVAILMVDTFLFVPLCWVAVGRIVNGVYKRGEKGGWS